MHPFPYGKTEMTALSSVDRRMKLLIDRYGYLERTVNPDLFSCLIESIVAQQISGKAAETVYAKLKQAVGDVTPEQILATQDNDLRSCGLSGRKVSYLKSAADFFSNEKNNTASFFEMSDRELISALTEIKGVGVWTAEMLMIFSLAKPNVLSFHDFGIRKAITALYGLTELGKNDFERYRTMFCPYGTVASFYLWQFANDNCVI